MNTHQPEDQYLLLPSQNWFSALSLGLILALSISLAFLSPIASAQSNDSILAESKIEKIESIDESDYVYIFCNPLTDQRVQKLIQGAKAPAELFDLSVKFFGPDEPYDADAVLAILEKVVDQSPTGIAMEIGHPSRFDQEISRSLEKGTYFISFSVDDWTGNPRQGYIGYNWGNTGEMLVDELFGDMPPRSKVLVLSSSTKQGSSFVRRKSITDRLKDYNFDYETLTAAPEKDALEEKILDYLENNEVDGMIYLWEEITEPLVEVISSNDFGSIRIGGYGFGEAGRFVESGHLDTVTEIETRLEGGIPLETLYYSSQYDVIPGTYELHSKPISKNK